MSDDMAITIKKIAEVSGVSRGTVDRVLNNRGRVHPETEAKVRRYAEELGYTPNLAAKALAVKKKSYTIGIILNSDGNEFYDVILSEIHRLAAEFTHYGIQVELRTMRGYDASKQLDLIHSLDGISGLIITPINDANIAAKLVQLQADGIPVITLNTDIENSDRLCYVGSDYYDGGCIAAGMLSLMRPRATIGIVNGSKKLYGHMRRVDGFKQTLNNRSYSIAYECESQDDDDIAYVETLKMLRTNPAIDTIFVVAAGVLGVCRAVTASRKDVSLITFDEIPTTISMVQQGIIQATISQQPELQGRKAMELLFEYLVHDKPPESDRFLVENQIKIKQNFKKKAR